LKKRKIFKNHHSLTVTATASFRHNKTSFTFTLKTLNGQLEPKHLKGALDFKNVIFISYFFNWDFADDRLGWGWNDCDAKLCDILTRMNVELFISRISEKI